MRQVPLVRSENKRTYLINGTYQAYALKASDLHKIIAHYQQKYGIKIFINGETDFAKPYLDTKRKEIERTIDVLQDDSQKYSKYLMKLWCAPGFTTGGSLERYEISTHNLRGNLTYNTILNSITPFLDKNQLIRQDLSDDKKIKLNDICKQLPCKATLDKLINSYLQKLPTDLVDCCIDKSTVLLEIEEIRKSLKEGEAVGYFFTNAHATKAHHFEIVIITKDEIIKPAEWNMPANESLIISDFNNQLFCPPVNWSIVKNDGYARKLPLPQAEEQSCGTLGMLYLKELLKKNGQQLKEFSLTFPYYDANGNIANLFLPSPQVLRYSQSSLYNELIATFVSQDSTASIKHNSDKNSQTVYTVTPLRSLLEESIKQATAKKDMQIVNYNKNILGNLNKFRENWLAEYHRTDSQRKKMYDDTGVNRYLVYSTKRMEQLISPPQLLKLEPGSAAKENSLSIYHPIIEIVPIAQPLYPLEDLIKQLITLDKYKLRDELRLDIANIKSIDDLQKYYLIINDNTIKQKLQDESGFHMIFGSKGHTKSWQTVVTALKDKARELVVSYQENAKTIPDNEHKIFFDVFNLTVTRWGNIFHILQTDYLSSYLRIKNELDGRGKPTPNS